MKREEFLIRVIDDDQDLLNSVKFILEVEGWKVKTYLNAENFLADSDFDTPGCIVLDIRIPGISGVELQEMLEDYRNRLPIIFLSGHGDLNTAIHVFRNGAFDFFQKPVNPDIFVEAVKKAALKSEEDMERRLAFSPWQLFKELTDRQKNVLKLMEEGIPSVLQAERLGISERTLERHRQNTMKKLGLKTKEDIKNFMKEVRKGPVSIRKAKGSENSR